MHKLHLIIYFFYFTQNIYCQDSIKFINKETLPVKLIEIGINDLKYIRLDNLNGPKYTVSKSEISYIKYETGITDTIKVLQKNSMLQNNSEFKTLHFNKAWFYEESVLNEKNVYALLTKVFDKEKKIKLFSEFSLMKKHKRNQYLSWFGGISLGVIALSTILDIDASHKSNSQKNIETTLAIAVGTTMIVTGTGFSIYFRKKRSDKKLAISLLYNETL